VSYRAPDINMEQLMNSEKGAAAAATFNQQ